MSRGTRANPEMFAVQPVIGSRSLADQVTSALRDQITAHTLPSTQLPSEQAMAAGFGVSRTVVREAIARLKAEGLLETQQGRGAFIRTDRLDEPYKIDVDSADAATTLLQILELRRGFDGEMAYLAALRRTRAQMAELRRALAAIGVAQRQGKNSIAEELDFQIAVAKATSNPLYHELVRFLSKYLMMATAVTRANTERRNRFSAEAWAEFSAIVEAIDQRDPDAASTAARMHMIRAAERVRSIAPAFAGVDLRTLERPIAEMQRQEAEQSAATAAEENPATIK